MPLADSWRRRLVVGGLVLAWGGLWLTRVAWERTMLAHMGAQLPLLALLGVLGVWAATTVPRIAAYARSDWGLPTAILCSAVLAVWMVPRLLDAAVELVAIDALKFVTVPGSAGLLTLVLRTARPPVQLFVAGNLAFMTAVVGKVLIDSPTRVCVSYGDADQRLAGAALIALVLVLTTIIALRHRRLRW